MFSLQPERLRKGAVAINWMFRGGVAWAAPHMRADLAKVSLKYIRYT